MISNDVSDENEPAEISAWRCKFLQRPQIQIGEWHDTGLVYFPFTADVELFLLKVETIVQDPKYNCQNAIIKSLTIRGTRYNADEPQHRLALEFTFISNHNIHSDLFRQFDDFEFSIWDVVHLYLPIPLVLSTVERIIRLLSVLLITHDVRTCPSMRCHARHFCCCCARLLDSEVKCGSTCYLCERKYCLDCDLFFTLRRSSKKVICTKLLNYDHKKAAQSWSLKEFSKPWIRFLHNTTPFPSVLNLLVISFLFFTETPRDLSPSLTAL